MDGFGALTGLRRNTKTADTPVIFLSAQGDAETKSQGLSLGAADYLAKPFSEQELMARVDRTLKLTAQKEHFRALAQTDGLTGLRTSAPFTRGWRRKSPGPIATGTPSPARWSISTG